MLDAVDAVYVCTWTSEHPRLVAAAVERGLPVFCEKPLATTLEAARAMTAAVRGGRGRQPGGPRAPQQPVVPRARAPARTIPATAACRPWCCATTSSCRCRACTARRGGATWPGPVPARCSSTPSTTSTRSSGCSDRSRPSAPGRRSFHGNPGIEDTVVVGIGFESGAQGSLTSVWHQLLERPSLRRLEVICERAFLTAGARRDRARHLDPPRRRQRARSRARRCSPRSPSATTGTCPTRTARFVEAVAAGAARARPRPAHGPAGPRGRRRRLPLSGRRRRRRRRLTTRPGPMVRPRGG